eukprot:6510014-Prymnesium_polylepis.1
MDELVRVFQDDAPPQLQIAPLLSRVDQERHRLSPLLDGDLRARSVPGVPGVGIATSTSGCVLSLSCAVLDLAGWGWGSWRGLQPQRRQDREAIIMFDWVHPRTSTTGSNRTGTAGSSAGS